MTGVSAKRDGVHQMEPICFNCARLREGRTASGHFGCEAFPDGVPLDIYLGEFDHTKPHEGDNGLRFQSHKDRELEQRRGSNPRP